MKTELKEIIEEHESNLLKYTQERDARQAKMQFMREHKFDNELQYLRTQHDAVSEIFYDYRKAIGALREILNDENKQP